MRKFKDLNLNERLLLIMAILLILAIIIKWPTVKEGFIKGWKHFGVEFKSK